MNSKSNEFNPSANPTLCCDISSITTLIANTWWECWGRVNIEIHIKTIEKYHLLILTACSEAVEPIAAISKHFKMSVITYAAEGVSFEEREQYPYFFRTVSITYYMILANNKFSIFKSPQIGESKQ